MFYKPKLDKDNAIKTAFKDPRGRPLIYFWREPKAANVKATKYVEDLVGKCSFRYEKDTKNTYKKTDGNIED